MQVKGCIISLPRLGRIKPLQCAHKNPDTPTGQGLIGDENVSLCGYICSRFLTNLQCCEFFAFAVLLVAQRAWMPYHQAGLLQVVNLPFPPSSHTMHLVVRN